eukprot:TRINITY_DN2040_c0_g1_i1.p1 TRINITY_DN2040_c0_g1~~TRINITY_DN2040_c0_g1_i1.p1  ORF type:complete len:352 (-),score=57.60 TRINITY_DN2040_c0_g1_i1:148-1203(-)
MNYTGYPQRFNPFYPNQPRPLDTNYPHQFVSPGGGINLPRPQQVYMGISRRDNQAPPHYSYGGQSEGFMDSQMNHSHVVTQFNQSSSEYNVPHQMPPNARSIHTPSSEEDKNNAKAKLKEFKEQLFEQLDNQQKVLEDLNKKSNNFSSDLSDIAHRIGEIRKQMSEISTTGAEGLKAGQIMLDPGQLPTSDNLLTLLCGSKFFSYSLMFKPDPPEEIYKERNFKLSVGLFDSFLNPVTKHEKIKLVASIYSSEVPPRLIENNTLGQKLLKGVVDKVMVNGHAIFDKVQIREVTSHYRNGWVFLVITPQECSSSSAKDGQKVEEGENLVRACDIKPLILERLKVKAKKMKYP